ncbi:hypothetical protein QYF61_016375 [Mycteria americana]|uniref:RNase H type-1 domain-containing protein n=1 Tax=Mycteria americana TaxID=33587 RepID=A0AAN7MRK6_MYCAM|nr:hypothetical protein QYF61_016375 [Mycteria americana]
MGERIERAKSKPPLAQLEVDPSHPITCYLGEETDTHLATTSFQVVVESNKVSPQPPFLQAKQPQFPQPLLIRLLLQSLHQLRCPSLDTLQHLNVSLVVRGPNQNTVFEVWPHQCRVQRDNCFPSPAGHTISDTSQDAIGLLGHLGTLLAHIQPAVNQHPQSLSTLKQINTPTQLGVVCKLTEGALDPFVQIIDKHIKQNWPQHRALGDTTCDRPPTGVNSIHHHSLGPAIQPVLYPEKSTPIQAMSSQFLQENAVGNRVKGFTRVQGIGFLRKRLSMRKKKVQYMGFEITKGQRELSTERKEAICRIAVPTSKKQLGGFLGMAGWCRLWIPNFGLIAKPLYAAVKGPEGVLEWTPECRKSFDEIKRKPMEASALGLPNLRKPFQLYQVALGVLTQKLGSWKRPVGYFSKQLHEVSKGQPTCLRAVAATATLIEESWKLTLGQPITVFVPHAESSLLEDKGHHWISPSRVAKYQVVLLEQDDVVISLTSALNPATLLPISEFGELHHDCLTTIEQVYSSRPDLRDEPLSNAELEVFTDGSSFMLEGRRKAGYAVVTHTRALEAKSLPSNTSAQKAELVALTRALELSQGKRVNIYTDSKYAFGVVHAHGAIWKERGLLSSHGTPIKYGTEIMKLLQAVLQLKEDAIMRCKVHQKGNIPHLELSPPQYTEKENQLAGQLDCSKNDQGWWVTPLKQLLISEKMMEILLKKLHQETHSGADALMLIAKRHIIGPRMQSLVDIIVKKCYLLRQ